MSMNLFADLPSHPPDEGKTTLVEAAHVRIERIVSHGHASPEGFWYDQNQHEWVMVLQGAARLRFEDGVIQMRPGDFVNIPAHRKHRVEWTTPDEPTVWLAVSDETPFRIALAVVMVLTVSIGLYYRLQAAASGEKISWKEEGYAFAIVLRLTGVGLWIATLAYLLFPASVQWAAMPLPDWIRWIGAAVGIAGSGLMYWTLSSLGKNLTDTVVTRVDATLVTHGPYRWVRHPFYVTAALLMAAATLMAANWLIGLWSIVVLTLLAVRTPKEERFLVERFGQQYREYMARTGRFLPRF